MLAIHSFAANAMVMSTPSAAPPAIASKAFIEAMPGVSAPFGLFDPLGTTEDKSEQEIMLYREAEITHGRVAMMASLGYLIQEKFHPIFSYPAMDQEPVIRQLDEVLRSETGQFYSSFLLMAIFFSEFHRARTGWVDPKIEVRTLREGYIPGSLNFDPLGMMPKDEAGAKIMRTKELNNGRLAMLAVAGMTAQELVTGTKLF